MINLSRVIHHLANNYRVSYDSHGSLGHGLAYLTNPKIKRKQRAAALLSSRKGIPLEFYSRQHKMKRREKHGQTDEANARSCFVFVEAISG